MILLQLLLGNNNHSIIENFPYLLTLTHVVFEQPAISNKPIKPKLRKAKANNDDAIPPYNIIQPNQELEPIDSKLHRWLFSMGLLLPGYVIPKPRQTAEASELSEIDALKVSHITIIIIFILIETTRPNSDNCKRKKTMMVFLLNPSIYLCWDGHMIHTSMHVHILP